MKYENCDGYPEYFEKNENGDFIPWGSFGYPSEMLNMAISRDDPEGFKFYFDRYFSKDAEVLGGQTLIQHVKSKGATKIAAMLEQC